MSESLNDLLRVQLKAIQLDASVPLSEHIKRLEAKMSDLNFPTHPGMEKLIASVEKLNNNLKQLPNFTIGEMLVKAISMPPDVSLALPYSLLSYLSGYTSQTSVEGTVPFKGQEDNVNLTEVLQGLREEVAELKRSSVDGLGELKQSLNEMRTELEDNQQNANTMAIKLFIWSIILSIIVSFLSNDKFRDQFLTEVYQLFYSDVQIEHELPSEPKHPINFNGGEKS